MVHIDFLSQTRAFLAVFAENTAGLTITHESFIVLHDGALRTPRCVSVVTHTRLAIRTNATTRYDTVGQ